MSKKQIPQDDGCGNPPNVIADVVNCYGIEVPFHGTLVLFYSESCKLRFSQTDGFVDPMTGNDLPLPEGITHCAGESWGPGAPADGSDDLQITFQQDYPDPGACKNQAPRMIRSSLASHIIHIGSNPLTFEKALMRMDNHEDEFCGAWPGTKKLLEVLVEDGSLHLSPSVKAFVYTLIEAGNHLYGSKYAQ